MLRRVLIAYTSWPPIISYLQAAFARRGIEAKAFYADQNTWFDRFVIHRVNKLAHNFRIIPKSRNLFEDHPWSHMNYRSARLREAIAASNPERVQEALSETPWFDHFFFINSSSVEAARRAGFTHASYLPHAVDATIFRPLPGVERDLDFCFVGLWSEKRQRFLEAALELTENGAVYGPKWYVKTFG